MLTVNCYEFVCVKEPWVLVFTSYAYILKKDMYKHHIRIIKKSQQLMNLFTTFTEYHIRSQKPLYSDPSPHRASNFAASLNRGFSFKVV